MSTSSAPVQFCAYNFVSCGICYFAIVVHLDEIVPCTSHLQMWCVQKIRHICLLAANRFLEVKFPLRTLLTSAADAYQLKYFNSY